MLMKLIAARQSEHDKLQAIRVAEDIQPSGSMQLTLEPRMKLRAVVTGNQLRNGLQ